jgi:hypothetical protein
MLNLNELKKRLKLLALSKKQEPGCRIAGLLQLMATLKGFKY